MKKIFKSFYDIYSYPLGENPDLDIQSLDSFMRFLDYTYSILVFFFLFFAVGSMYFFIGKEVLNVL